MITFLYFLYWGQMKAVDLKTYFVRNIFPEKSCQPRVFVFLCVQYSIYIERNFWADSQVCICPFNYLCLNKFLFGSFKSFFYDQPSTLQVQASKQELKGVVVLWYFPCQMLKQCVRSKHHVCLQWYLKPPCVKISSGFFFLEAKFLLFFLRPSNF